MCVATGISLVGAELVKVPIGSNICERRLLLIGIEAIGPGCGLAIDQRKAASGDRCTNWPLPPAQRRHGSGQTRRTHEVPALQG
jgi:hypothetical protein